MDILDLSRMLSGSGVISCPVLATSNVVVVETCTVIRGDPGDPCALSIAGERTAERANDGIRKTDVIIVVVLLGALKVRSCEGEPV